MTGFKTTVLNMLSQMKEKKDGRQLSEIRKTIYEKNENINEDVEITVNKFWR